MLALSRYISKDLASVVLRYSITHVNQTSSESVEFNLTYKALDSQESYDYLMCHDRLVDFKKLSNRCRFCSMTDVIEASVSLDMVKYIHKQLTCKETRSAELDVDSGCFETAGKHGRKDIFNWMIDNDGGDHILTDIETDTYLAAKQSLKYHQIDMFAHIYRSGLKIQRPIDLGQITCRAYTDWKDPPLRAVADKCEISIKKLKRAMLRYITHESNSIGIIEYWINTMFRDVISKTDVGPNRMLYGNGVLYSGGLGSTQYFAKYRQP